ncbi:MAG: tripartite tricarboxylate transporter permease [Candidatus Atribacteria bacterium]|nr:tripartite tricarboxylate transporter permease [Candidatus Atribacteria bacterium]
MNFISNLMDGINYGFSFLNLLGILVGYLLGIIFGAIPGLTGGMAIVLLLPFTYNFSPIFAIATLMGIYKGGVYGGSITAILFNIPGTPMAAATAFDGYPMRIKGEGLRALEMALFASIIGGTVSNLLLMFTAPPLARVALKLGPAEISALIFFALTIITNLMGNAAIEIWKGLVAAGLGLLFSIVGLDMLTATRRYGFGIIQLDSGINYIVAIIGILALAEVFNQIDQAGELKLAVLKEVKIFKRPTMKSRLKDLKICAKDIFRSSIVGSIIGALPGLGATEAAFLGYGEAKRNSKHPETFGEGEIIGIAAPESANNAVCAASMIPLVTLGIPGSVVAAALFGAFMIQGMMPGPMLMKTNPEVIYGLFVLMLVTDILGGLIVAYPILYLAEKYMKKIAYNVLFPFIIVFCAVGSYGINFNTFDIKVLLFLGVFGYFIKRNGFFGPIFLIAFILGPFLERNVRTALIISKGSISIFLRSPVALILLAFSVIYTISSIKKKFKK